MVIPQSSATLLAVCSFANLVACGAADRSPPASASATAAPVTTARVASGPAATSPAVRGESAEVAGPRRHHAAASQAGADSFDALMHTAMVRMDEGMNVACTDDPDVDFAAMMVPHHQGAVDMAIVELRYGTDPRLRRLAEGIIVEQRQEIALMTSILAEKRTP